MLTYTLWSELNYGGWATPSNNPDKPRWTLKEFLLAVHTRPILTCLWCQRPTVLVLANKASELQWNEAPAVSWSDRAPFLLESGNSLDGVSYVRRWRLIPASAKRKWGQWILSPLDRLREASCNGWRRWEEIWQRAKPAALGVWLFSPVRRGLSR